MRDKGKLKKVLGLKCSDVRAPASIRHPATSPDGTSFLLHSGRVVTVVVTYRWTKSSVSVELTYLVLHALTCDCTVFSFSPWGPYQIQAGVAADPGQQLTKANISSWGRSVRRPVPTTGWWSFLLQLGPW